MKKVFLISAFDRRKNEYKGILIKKSVNGLRVAVDSATPSREHIKI